ncbi:MAG: YesU family protein [Lachnospiraceae bacterium]|nr:YesU family protein [Lachnospiraceae bacterium]
METLIYENSLACEDDIKDFILEGSAKLLFPNGKLRMENAISAEAGQKANFVLWCDKTFPDNVRITWKFRPIKEPGLAILFFSAMGINGEDIFDGSLQKRTGEYPLYHHGDINAFHVSYFRRKEPDERAFHTCNLRKSYGFHLVTQGADPIPDADECKEDYDLEVVKKGSYVSFSINGLRVFEFEDDGQTYGKLLEGGKIGFRQLAPMIAEYSELKVYEI